MRLRKLSEAFPGEIEIEHRSFILRGEHNPNAKFTEYHLQHRTRARDLTGLNYNLPQVGSKYPTSSLPALVAAKYVKHDSPDRFECFDTGLFAAFFEGSRDISDPAVLAEIAQTCGIDGEKLVASLNGQHLLQQVIADYDSAQSSGITGVPAVIIGNQLITGAVPLEDYESALRSARLS